MTDFSYKPTLTRDLMILRPVDEGDYEALAAAMDDPDVTRFTGSRGTIGEEKAREWYRTRKEQTDRLDLAIDGEWVDSIVKSVLAPEWKANL